MFAFPKNALILFFKAQQHALFAAPVTVQGHTRANGVFVAPYVSRRKKRMVPSKTADLFGAGQLQHPARTVATAVQPPDPPDPPLPPAGNPVEPPKARPSLLTSPAPPGGSGGGKGSNGGNGGNGGEPPDKKREAQRQYDAVVARYTLPDGTKAPGWMKAPNGQPTKLNERQWVQTRTENFKQWFGDWEVDAKLAEQVSQFVDDALASRRRDNLPLWTIPDWQATEIHRLIGIDVTGYQYEMVENDIRHAMGKHGDPKTEAKRKNPREAITADDLKAIPYILSSPDRIRAGAEKGGRKSVIFSKRVDGIIDFVEVVASEDGRLLNKTMWKRPGAEGTDADKANPDNTSESAATPGLYKDIGDFLEKSKPSMVVDENGEPRVVYHGTAANFSKFEKLPSIPMAEIGFWFAGDPNVAFLVAMRKGDSAALMPGFLSIKNPYEISNGLRGLVDVVSRGSVTREAITAFRDRIKSDVTT